MDTHTSFRLLSFCLSHRINLIHSNTPPTNKREGEASQTTARGVKHLHAKTQCEFLMKQQLSCFTLHILQLKQNPLPAVVGEGAAEFSPSFCLSVLLKTRCSSQRWTMMYVLHFGIDWGHRLHKCLRQVWYFNLFLVGGDVGPLPNQYTGQQPCQDISWQLFIVLSESWNVNPNSAAQTEAEICLSAVKNIFLLWPRSFWQ